MVSRIGPPRHGPPRIGIVVVAYNAATTLAQVLDRIPPEFRENLDAVLVSDDASSDATYLVGLGYQSADPDLPLQVIRNEHNLGYGGNQKVCYRWAIEHDLDIVVLLHGDGQYAPESLPDIVAPLVQGEADAVFGSRIMQKGEARRGGMPLYKFVGNRILSTLQNTIAGADLSEWHSGYRAYSVAALADVPFEANVDGFNFDTQIIVQFLEAQKRIVEVPIPTYYGDEICHVEGIPYGLGVLRDVARYRAHKMGFGTGSLAFASTTYEQKTDVDSSHGILRARLERHGRARVLDLGCGDGSLGAALRESGSEVVGVDLHETPGVRDRLDHFVKADLDQGLPAGLGGDVDVVVAADVFEHLREPEALLDQLAVVLRPGVSVVTSIPNFAHWYPRLRVASGRFDYDRRGILDRTHLRFFTRRSFERMLSAHDWTVRHREYIGVPFEVTDRGGRAPSRWAGRLARLDGALARAWPNLFAYQIVYELEPPSSSSTR
ncbi:MAG TPA: bifunctional glycosyltransferase/class I SAM-dependent methyltransferase [Microthrixaceae bacterium]|nr:bifunctional glycosyltransferase/class I SAM-dependent methyltransferase [Microthrixaceae bacterium]